MKAVFWLNFVCHSYVPSRYQLELYIHFILWKLYYDAYQYQSKIMEAGIRFQRLHGEISKSISQSCTFQKFDVYCRSCDVNHIIPFARPFRNVSSSSWRSSISWLYILLWMVIWYMLNQMRLDVSLLKLVAPLGSHQKVWHFSWLAFNRARGCSLLAFIEYSCMCVFTSAKSFCNHEDIIIHHGGVAMKVTYVLPLTA